MTAPSNQSKAPKESEAPDPAAIARALEGGRLPPVHLWNPDDCGEIEMRISRDGTWFHEGRPITRRRMVRLFSTILRRDADGVHYLVTPAEKLAIQVDDAPFVAVEMTTHGAGEAQVLVFRTNVDDQVMAGPAHPIRLERAGASDEPAPYVRVRDGLDALIARPVFYDLVELGVEAEVAGEAHLGVWSAGAFFPLAPMAELEDL